MGVWTMPLTLPAPNRYVMGMESNVQEFRSPFTGASQNDDNLGERLTMTLYFNNLTDTDRGLMQAWLTQCNGRQHEGRIEMPWRQNNGVGGGTPLVSGANQLGYQMLIDGASPSVTNWISAGDLFSVNGELKISTATRNSSSGGFVTLNFMPRLRTAPPDNSAVSISNPTTNWKLKNTQQWLTTPGGFTDFVIDMVENIG